MTEKTRSGSGLSTRLGNASPLPSQPDPEKFADTLTLEQLRKLADEQLRRENGEK
jgi:hypothetical protein